MEPVSVINVGAIVTEAAEALKPVAEQGVKDGYQGLKKSIADLYGHDRKWITAVDSMAEKPDDEWKPFSPIAGHAIGPVR